MSLWEGCVATEKIQGPEDIGRTENWTDKGRFEFSIYFRETGSNIWGTLFTKGAKSTSGRTDLFSGSTRY